MGVSGQGPRKGKEKADLGQGDFQGGCLVLMEGTEHSVPSRDCLEERWLGSTWCGKERRGR